MDEPGRLALRATTRPSRQGRFARRPGRRDPLVLHDLEDDISIDGGIPCAPGAGRRRRRPRPGRRRLRRRRRRRPPTRPRAATSDRPTTERRRRRRPTTPRDRADRDVRATTAPATTAAADVPQRIVSLSPTQTEMLFAIGAGDQVVAVDDHLELPARGGRRDDRAVRVRAQRRGDRRRTSPTSSSPTATNPDLLEQLDALGIAHWEGPAAVDARRHLRPDRAARRATGHVAEAAELVGQMQADIDEIVAGDAARSRRR